MAYTKPQYPLKNGDNYIYPVTTHDQILLDDGSRWDGDVGVTSVNGETGAANLTYSDVGAAAASHTHTVDSLSSIGTNPITSTANDTTANWREMDTCVCFYSQTGCLIDQPSQYGILVSFVHGVEVHQIWMIQTSGKVYHRGGSYSGWSGTWKNMVDASCFSLSGTTLTITTT